ncbi:Thiol-disulfide isomerase or thioredoxin [Catalinimonas alkaloidigena]|uniref:Thiol-disulfide isomerase or thioredoxin n=1 Tax=Catalinimonas alkaloidigena TaxID=1075417 RepID=A0A1G8XKF9_9BACT|nr:thioredoxin-like domain-containing protein [Catalinimonas alkaloidigena]SDJ91142.1 Thiol-disulfide isomerase or thioredoxin [Catalinimonas alkaloidigena]
MHTRRLALLLSLVACLTTAFVLRQRYRLYKAPTTLALSVPAPLSARPVTLAPFIEQRHHRPVFVQFFDPDCQYARFTMKEMGTLVEKYGDEVDFYVVLVSEPDKAAQAEEYFLRRYDLNVRLVNDPTNALAAQCGVRASPQALLLDAQGQLFYRGNFNIAPFSTDTQTAYAYQALVALLNQRPLEVPQEAWTEPTGCRLPLERQQLDRSLSWFDL